MALYQDKAVSVSLAFLCLVLVLGTHPLSIHF